jgi:hypothetical protein
MKGQSPVFVKSEAFMIWLLNHTAAFPKHERFRLAKRMDDALFDLHKALMQAAHRTNTQEWLHEADIQLQYLRAYFRLALELRYTTPDQFHFVAEQLDEIGRLIGGWGKKA